jgi:MFS family permease
VRYLVLAAGCSLALVAYIHRLGFPNYLSEIKSDFGLSSEDVGYLTAAFLIAYGFGQIPAGLAGDRWGARLLLPVFVLGWSLATAALGLVPADVPSVWQPLALFLQPLVLLLALRALFGVLQSGAFPVFTRVVADWIPLTERASAQGIMWTASRVGFSLSPLLLVWLLEVCGGWRLPFALLGGIGVLWSAAFWSWFRNRPEEMPRVNAAELALIHAGQVHAVGRPPAVPWRRILGSRSVWFLCLMYGCCGPAGNFMIVMLTYYLRESRGFPKETAAWLQALPFAGGAAACVLGGLASDWLIRRWGSRTWGRRVNGIAGLGLAGLAFAATAWVEDVWLLGLLLCAAQFGNDFCMGPAWAACADIGERYAGTLSGAMNMTSNITGAVGAAVAGYLIDQHLAGWIFIVFGGAWLAGGFCWLGIDVAKPLRPGE